MTIWKFALKVTESQEIKLPKGASFLSCQFQRDELMLWAVVEPMEDLETRMIYIVGTGRSMPYLNLPTSYIGTVQQDGGRFVWHVFAEAR